MASKVIEKEEKVKKIRSFLEMDIPEADILKALSESGNDIDAAITLILATPGFGNPPISVRRTSTGARISTEGKREADKKEPFVNQKSNLGVKDEKFDLGIDESLKVKEESVEVSQYVENKGMSDQKSVFDEWEQMVPTKEPKPFDGLKVKSQLEQKKQELLEKPTTPLEKCDDLKKGSDIVAQKEPKNDLDVKRKGFVKEESVDVDEYQPKRAKNDFECENISVGDVTGLGSNYFSSYNHQNKPVYKKQEKPKEKVVLPGLSEVEDGEFPDDPNWVLVGRSTVAGLSTCRGRKLAFNEIVHFTFPTTSRTKIVRFSTKRSGEVGRLPIEWTKCIIPLVSASKVKILGRCVAAPLELSLMQEIHLYVSFYIHHSIFTDGDKSTWNLTSPLNMDTTLHPLPTLFKLLNIRPFQKAEFTPEELSSRKRSVDSEGSTEGDLHMISLMKRRKLNNSRCSEQNGDDVVSESTLNKLVGTADVYNLKEMDPPSTLMCVLHPYQKQALYWMSESERGVDVEQAAKTLHPCWEAYRLTDKRSSAVYVNIFSGEATTRYPSATKTAKGGILADAMGLGKTVMTIALILARSGKGVPYKEVAEGEGLKEEMQNKRQPESKSTQTVKGGTLIVCPMALLGQWKDELDTHSRPGTLQVLVQYGTDRSVNPVTLSENDVVLTTYGVLTAAYKSDMEESIFHKVEWFRVVLDEAHTIKSSKTQVAQAAFALSSHCRWCLTGTPIQNNLEDLYSLLCFLHVEPWCNWAWWQKLIQKPYENGDERAMRLIKSILRQLMLRRTKDTQDKEGRPILVLPPTDIQVIECQQSEAERDFYDALFKRSKVQFDQFVAQGKVLHNYANILELLLRLRQCCNHPFLVMSRADSQKYVDLSKLARQFLDNNSNSRGQSQAAPTRAYVEEVVEDIRKGENTECPICLESADDPVLTPCAHRMCRECLFSSWRSSLSGLCPICRRHIQKNELITCPTDNQFRVDTEKNWKESSKVSKLLDCLEKLHQKGSGEKSIVFSQWTSFFDLLQIPLRRKGIGFLRFDGKLSQKNREHVLKEFSESKEKKVLLMSLKAGGVGLNLTAASNVFLMDPWWNPAVEEQAIMRIHRIGQKRTVNVRRFIVKDTVEERMQQVQARKERMIAGALTDGEVRTARIEELKMLFR